MKRDWCHRNGLRRYRCGVIRVLKSSRQTNRADAVKYSTGVRRSGRARRPAVQQTYTSLARRPAFNASLIRDAELMDTPEIWSRQITVKPYEIGRSSPIRRLFDISLSVVLGTWHRSSSIKWRVKSTVTNCSDKLGYLTVAASQCETDKDIVSNRKHMRARCTCVSLQTRHSYSRHMTY